MKVGHRKMMKKCQALIMVSWIEKHYVALTYGELDEEAPKKNDGTVK